MQKKLVLFMIFTTWRFFSFSCKNVVTDLSSLFNHLTFSDEINTTGKSVFSYSKFFSGIWNGLPDNEKNIQKIFWHHCNNYIPRRNVINLPEFTMPTLIHLLEHNETIPFLNQTIFQDYIKLPEKYKWSKKILNAFYANLRVSKKYLFVLKRA